MYPWHSEAEVVLNTTLPLLFQLKYDCSIAIGKNYSVFCWFEDSHISNSRVGLVSSMFCESIEKL